MTEWVIDPDLQVPVRRSKRNMGKVVDYRPFYYELWRPEKHPPKRAPVKTVLTRNQHLGTLLDQNAQRSQNETPSFAKYGVKRRIEDSPDRFTSQWIRAAPKMLTQGAQNDTSSKKRRLKKEKLNTKQGHCRKKTSKATESRKELSYVKPKLRVQALEACRTAPTVLPRGGVRGPLSQNPVLREEGDSNLILSEHSSLFGLSLNSPARRQNRRFPATPRPHGNSFDSDDFEEDNDEQDIFVDRVEVASDDVAVTARGTFMVREQTERRYDPVNGPPGEFVTNGENLSKYRRPSPGYSLLPSPALPAAVPEHVRISAPAEHPHNGHSRSNPNGSRSRCSAGRSIPADISNSGHLAYSSRYSHECTATTPRSQHTTQNSRTGMEIFNYILDLASGKGNQQERLDEIRRCAQSYTQLNYNLPRENGLEVPSTSRTNPPRQST